MSSETQIKVGGAALNQIPLDWSGNRDRILSAIAQARQAGVRFLCLPELCISGYGCEDAFHSWEVGEYALDSLLKIVPHTENLAVALGLPIHFNQVVYNCAAFVVNGKLCGLVAKQFLAGQDIYYEPRWFRAWKAGNHQVWTRRGLTVPIGDLMFEVDGVRVGFEICEDAWVVQRPGRHLATQGVDLILNPSASHFSFDQYQHRRNIVVEGARSMAVAYVYANLLGCEAGRILYDGSVFIACGNRGLIHEGARFGYVDVQLSQATIDLDWNRLQRRKNTNYLPNPSHPDNLVNCQVERHQFRSMEKQDSSPSVATAGQPSRFEEFSRAVPLGLFDYLRKSRSRGFVVSVSGGADSTTVITLIYLMVKQALQQLGVNQFKEKLAHIHWPEDANTARQLTHQLCLTVYQASEHSSSTTLNAAKAVCEAYGCRFHTFNITPLTAMYTQWASQVLGRPLDWDTDDLSLQNIQARVRGPSVWLMANLHGFLLLSTSNRSEAAVGYATMDGDTCGGLSPIAGIDKAFILQWLRWMELQAAQDNAFSALKSVNQQKPTAELRPATAMQNDEADLMPYPILDAIEKAAIRDRRSPVEVWNLLLSRQEIKGTWSAEELASFVHRFFQLWSRNQWKRERYAPSFHLDDENLDPKTWCRFPILSGGFVDELQVLQAHLKEFLSGKSDAKS